MNDLRTEIITGIQRLFALRLPGSPSADAVVATAEMWVEAVSARLPCYDADADAPRIRRAFVALMQDMERWPAPKHFFERLADRPPVRALPQPRADPKETAAARAQFKALHRKLVKKLTVEH